MYPYTEDLLALDQCVGRGPPPGALAGVYTPLKVSAWEEVLWTHPDRRYAGYILKGLREGFRIGASRDRRIHPASYTLPSAYQQRRVVTEYLISEARLGRMLGPLDTASVVGMTIQVNWIGAIPKGQSGKWRLITDLSHPAGCSINDANDPDLRSLTYTTVERVAQRVMRSGAGALMAKVDIESAYRLVPVHTQDRTLLGILWEGSMFVDVMLPFGLQSVPKIINAVADAIQ